MPKAYSYIRVSTVDQAEHGFSLEAQENAAQIYIDLLALDPKNADLQWGGMLTDAGVSASKKNLVDRPAGGKLDCLLRPGDHVIFCRMDRAFRRIADFVNMMPIWEKRGISIHFVDQRIDMSTASGKLIANVLASVSQWESDVRSERTKAGLAVSRAQGYATGGMAPMGYKKINAPKTKRNPDGKKKKLAPCWRTRAIMRLIRMARHHGNSFDEISDQIEAMLAKRERRAMKRPVWDKREWSGDRCKRAYHEIWRLWPDSDARPEREARREGMAHLHAYAT
jgi:DNA invertase Pin-like site-specific DNA recombinase